MNEKEKAFCDRVIVAGVHQAKYHTFEYVETILREGIPGDFVECGVFCGGHAAVASYVFKKWGVTDRKIHLFDSFRGIPKAGPKDCKDVHATYGTSSGTMETSGKCAVGIEQLYNFFKGWEVTTEYLVCHPGWFQDVMESEAKQIDKIAFLRVDVDLYDSTKICYQNLYGKVVHGGVVCDDDWGAHNADAPACRVAALEVIDQPANVFEVPGHSTTSFWRIP